MARLLTGCAAEPPPVAPTPPASSDVIETEDTAEDVDAVSWDGVCGSDQECETHWMDVGACEKARCDLLSGKCQAMNQPDGLACDDANSCTLNEACMAGACVGGIQFPCDDENACTHDTCDPTLGCISTIIDGPCDDGDPCTVGDTCSNGLCVENTPTNCDDGIFCTTDTCSPEDGCVHTTMSGLECDDENACTPSSTCASDGTCKGNGLTNCDDGDVCTSDSCNPEIGCISEPSSASCSDNNQCTGPDVCQNGVCGGPPLSCDDGDPCTMDSCAMDEGCLNEPFLGACDDENPCTIDEVCDELGECVGLVVDCDDDNSCTLSYCDSISGCQLTVLQGANCDDGDLCTSWDACDDQGNCTAGTATDCGDLNPCTVDTCEPEIGCVNSELAGDDCDDGNPCTENETCLQGTCVGTPTDCNDDNVCTQDSCSFVWGCTYSDADNECDDGSVCTTNDACLAGVCGGDPLSCDDGDDCTEDLCHQVEGCAYEPKPEDSPCDDQDACTLEDLCQLGACVSTGGVLECFDDDACTSDLCDVELGCAFATEPACLPPTAWPVINEIDSDQEGVDSSDFIELLIVGDQEADLTLYTVVLIDGTSGVPYNIINLSKAGELATAGTRIVIGPPSIANAPSESALGVVTVGDFLQSGGGDGDAIEIMRNGTEFIDTVSYGGVVESAAEGEGHAGVDAGLPDSPISLGRCPDGTDEDDNALDFAPGSPTPGLVNDCSG